MNNSKLGFINNNRRELGMLGLLIALIVITSWGTRESGVQALFESKFLSADNLKNISREIGIYGIFSIGVGIVIITAGIDLSVGSLMALLGVVFLYFVTPPETRPDSFLAKVIPEIPWFAAILFTLLIGTAIGVFQGLLVGKLKLQAFIVTLCGLLSYRGLARFSADDTSINISDSSQNLEFLRFLGEGSLSDVISNGNGSGFLHSIPMSFIYLVCFAIFFGVLLHKSVFGRYIFAAGRNELATKYSGINTNIVIACAYVIAGFCTAFSAIPFCIYTGSVQPATHGAFFELYAIAAAVLGGCSLRGGEGSIIGILIGTAILIVLRNMVNLFGYPTPLSDAITGGVIFVGVLLDQHGASSIKKLFSKKPVSGN